MRLVLACLVVSLALISACDGDGSPTATPFPTLSAAPASTIGSTPTPVFGQTAEPGATIFVSACMASNLAGAVVHIGVALGTAYYQLGVTNKSPQACTLSGPPNILFLDASGSGFLVAVDYTGAQCGTGVVDPSTCIDSRPIVLQPGAQTPADQISSGQVKVTVAIANAGNFNPLPTPTLEAHSIALKFPGAGGGVVVPLPKDVTLIPSGQVRLHGYGATQTP